MPRSWRGSGRYLIEPAHEPVVRPSDWVEVDQAGRNEELAVVAALLQSLEGGYDVLWHLDHEHVIAVNPFVGVEWLV